MTGRSFIAAGSVHIARFHGFDGLRALQSKAWHDRDLELNQPGPGATEPHDGTASAAARHASLSHDGPDAWPRACRAFGVAARFHQCRPRWVQRPPGRSPAVIPPGRSSLQALPALARRRRAGPRPRCASARSLRFPFLQHKQTAPTDCRHAMSRWVTNTDDTR